MTEPTTAREGEFEVRFIFEAQGDDLLAHEDDFRHIISDPGAYPIHGQVIDGETGESREFTIERPKVSVP